MSLSSMYRPLLRCHTPTWRTRVMRGSGGEEGGARSPRDGGGEEGSGRVGGWGGGTREEVWN